MCFKNRKVKIYISHVNIYFGKTTQSDDCWGHEFARAGVLNILNNVEYLIWQPRL